MNSSLFHATRLISFALVLSCAGCDGSGMLTATPDKVVPPKASTAQPNVSLLPQLLDMPGLNRQRQLRIYLPPGYAESGDKRYPVLYMHDGQNLFDVATAYAGEWQVDESLNALAKAGKLELIVVGIDNGQEKRITELNPWPDPDTKLGAPEGEAYLNFIVKVVKPMIDSQYRTQAEPAHTGIMGSSMGGLISHYAITRYPSVFGMAGVFSPSYWAGGAPALDHFAAKPAATEARLFLLMGEKEGGNMVSNVEKVNAALLRGGHPPANLSLKITPGAGHNEAFWASEFERAVLWMFAPGP
ncbi:alpha/beta hydrolase [Roseateles albus]|uniref:Alpha/beta hydrolase-fold protein n=1 Tax=Roseateles albus TaxID=2987525 RepID=A0ABT5K8D1_9BURK|nr:alpha/beta hydrolase-fold protein [Roseateles albus]MDC8770093.1 alpha/beta hydrolase-fold protein [Roseateles albus]